MINNKLKHEYFTNFKSCAQYAYREDTNFPIRNQMEDSHYYLDDCFKDGTSGIFVVYDGHGGNDVVDYLTTALPETFVKDFKSFNPFKPAEYFEAVFKKVDDQLKFVGAQEIGATCCFTLIRKEQNARRLYVANLGDTRAVLNLDGKAMRLTVDHKATDPDEQMRVKREGGEIVRGRVNNRLAVTRAFGDLDLKPYVSIKPDVRVVELTPSARYMIMASDGLWDVLEDQKAVEITSGLQSAEQMTQELLKHALKAGSRDNISIIVIVF